MVCFTGERGMWSNTKMMAIVRVPGYRTCDSRQRHGKGVGVEGRLTKLWCSPCHLNWGSFGYTSPPPLPPRVCKQKAEREQLIINDIN